MEYIFNLSLDSHKMCLPALRNRLSVLHLFHPSRTNAALGLGEGTSEVRHGHTHVKIKIYVR